MPKSDLAPATELFRRWRAGDDAALDRLLPLVYDELRRIAQRHLRGERADHTLQTTALIHEAYLRLIEQPPRNVGSRCHFVAVASHLMRQILVDHARERLALKRQGGRRITLSDDLVASQPMDVDLLAVNDALDRLAQLDAQQARVVELRYFGGLSIEETAEALGISEATVKRDWTTARAWLHREMRQPHAQ
ncbi:MAG TPA: sigma-70 family RNA polymerase sigma factor [Steroidobacteraceae bacterium]|nr:sigma-70 family RNA polymerase sigma factor [Steroidobacteraceae bacterium]